MPQNHQKRLKCRKTANICGKNEIVKDKGKEKLGLQLPLKLKMLQFYYELNP